MFKKLATAAFTAALALALFAPSVHAQKALVYCPVGVDAAGCDRVVAALQSKFVDGVDRGYDGSAGTIDLTKADLNHYGVVVVPSLADNADKQPYAVLRSAAARLRLAINGRVAVYSGAPDQGSANRSDKDAIIQNLALWAAKGHTRGTSLVGLVAFLDLSDNESDRYAWVKDVSLVDVSADAELQAFPEVSTVSPRGGKLLSSGGKALRFANMASYGLHVGRRAAARTEVGAFGGASGAQSVLVTYANADGADDDSGLSTGKVGSSGASFNLSAGSSASLSTSSSTAGATLTTDKADYLPGETVTFSGTGWGANDTITITIHEDPQWSHPDRTLKAVANASGSFTDQTFVVDQRDFGVTFTATAVGNPSGFVAQTTFTDGNVLAVSGTQVRSTSATPGSCGASTPATFTVGTEYCGQTTVTSISGGGTHDLFMRWVRPDGTETCVVSVDVAAGTTYVDKCTPNVPSTATDWLFQVSTQSNFNTLFASISVHVVAANTAPIAVNDTYSTSEDAALVVPVNGVLGNDTDPDNNALTAVLVAGPTAAQGTLVLNANGSFTFTPAADFNGNASFTYQANDGTANSATATVTITVNAINDAPTFTLIGNQTVNEDAGAQSVANAVTAKTAGPANENAQTLTLTVTNDNNPLFSVQPAVDGSGTLTYTPAANANGSATVTVLLKDNGGTASGGVDSVKKTLTITVNPVNDVPSFTKGADQTVNEDAGAQTVTPWATAISAGPNEAAQVLDFVVSNNNNALFSVQPSVSALGTLTYTPAANASGTATVTVHIHDDGGVINGGIDASGTQTFTITVNPVNDAPSFTKGADQTVNEDVAAQTVNAWATAISAGPNETQTLNFIVSNDNNALFSAQPSIDATGKLTYTPAANAYGAATVTVQIHDDGGTATGGVDTSAPQTFTITVNPVNDAPSFTKGADHTVNEDAGAQTVNGWATAISTGPNEASQIVDFVVTNNNNALFSAQPAVDANGKLTYTPATNANGSATVTIHAHDNGGTANGGVDASADQTFVINVNAVNDAPSFTKGANETKLEDAGAQTVVGWATAISAGPADEVGQTLSFTVTNDNNPLFSVQPAIAPNGTLTYTLAADANSAAIVTVTLKDNGGTPNSGVDTSAPQTFTITVTAVNDAPSFTKGADQTTLEDAGPQTVGGWATAISKGPANESSQTVSFNITGNTNAALFSTPPSVAANGTLTYTPAADAFGTATITIAAQDNGGTANGGVDTSPTQTFTITITPVNDAPTFGLIASHTVLEDAGAQSVASVLTSPIAGPASESGQTLTLTVTNDNNGLFSAQPAINASGTLTYTPAANAYGTAIVTVMLKDDGGTANGGVDATTKTLTITVTPVNDAPSFTKGADQTVNEDAGAQTVNGWATAISAGPNEASQIVDFVVTNNNNGLFSAQPIVDATGKLTYTPAPNANGSATVTIHAHDNGGTVNGGVDASADQTFVINVTAVNDVPSFTKGADQTVLEDAGAQSVPTWATAISAGPADEAGQVIDFVISNNTNTGLFSVQPAVAANGTLTYTPAPNAFGVATVTLHVHDNGGIANGGVDASADQTFTITITAVNDAPSFTKGADQTKLEDAGPQTVAGWATAISKGPANESGQTVNFIVSNDNNSLFSSQPAVDASGQLTYVPAANANGSATVTVQIHDDGGTANGGVDTSPTQTFTITITPVNDAPTFGLIASHTVLEDAGAQSVASALTSPIAGPANESGQTLTLTVTNDNNGLFSAQPAIDASGTLTYTPAANAYGTAIVTVVLKDDGGTANGGVDATTKTLNITVTPVNDAPSFTKGANQTSLEDAGAQTVNGWATAISAGPNEASQTVDFVVTNDNNGLFSVQPGIDPTGKLTYTAAPNANGSATVTVKLHDDGGTANGGVNLSAEQTFTINVTAVNDAPSFTKGANETKLEDAGAQTVVGWATAISAGPADEVGQTLSFTVTNDNNPLFSVQPAIAPNGTLTYTLAADANGAAIVTVTLKDNGGTANSGVDTSAPQTFTITVTAVNDAPSFTKGADQTTLEDAGPQTVGGWATAISKGPANESSQTVSFNITGNTNATLFSTPPAVAANGTLTYTPAADAFGTATITIAAQDNGGTANGGVDTSPTQTFMITITPVNDAPLYTLIGTTSSAEDAGPQTVAGALTGASPGPSNESGQTLSITTTNNNNSLFSAQPSINLSTGVLTYTAAPNANGSATVTVIVKDDGGTANGGVDATTKTLTITVTKVNDAPVVTDFSSPLLPNAVNTPVSASGVFQDYDLGDSPPDTHSASTINWGDGVTTGVNIASGSGTTRNFSGSHSYSAAGVYTVVVYIKDAAGAVDDSTYQYVVVYDPGAGFVTGGGWIASPAGAYPANPSLTGKATFGFVSKYKKGQSIPDGDTEFQFHAAGMNFKSTAYEWLVVAGSKAQFKGSGTVNGSGDYFFMLTATDGDLKAKGTPDTFRMKVWDKTTLAVIYDNLMSAPDTADPTTILGGGSIQIHDK